MPGSGPGPTPRRVRAGASGGGVRPAEELDLGDRHLTDGLHRYAHPLLRDAVLTGWTSGRRREAHRAAAEELMREGAPVGVVTRHLHHGAAVAEPWAVDVLLDAAAEGRTNAEIAASLHLARRTELPAALPPAPYGPEARAG
ncbi:hypothetical protein ACFW5X_24600 [Streptomyces albogriseolus]|uniref:hypothetical protein n=1 Tax=Streptomyces albogriseolus TaxID=1887 RepID=UPI0036BC6724